MTMKKIFLSALIFLSFLSGFSQVKGYYGNTNSQARMRGDWYYNVSPTTFVTADSLRIVYFRMLKDSLAGVRALIAAGGYTLPTASTSVLGGVKVDGTSITISGSGVISAVTGGTPGGSSLQMQYYNGGVFGGTNNMTWDGTNSILKNVGGGFLVQGTSYFQMWKDGTPSKGATWGMAIPGGSVTDDVILSTFSPSTWTERMRIKNTGAIQFKAYGAGSITGTAAFYLATDASGNIIETTPSGGMTNPMTTTGDLIYSSSGSTPARRAIGSTWDDLSVVSGLPNWIPRLRWKNTVFAPTTGQTITLTNNARNIINPSGTIAALTANLPNSPSDGDVMLIKFVNTVSSMTWTSGTGGATLANGYTTTASTEVNLTYNATDNKWY